MVNLSKIQEVENRIVQLQKVKQVDKKTRNRLNILYETCEEQKYIVENSEYPVTDETMDEVLREVEMCEMFHKCWGNLKMYKSVSDKTR